MPQARHCGQRPVLAVSEMNHTHEYAYWHAHEHNHGPGHDAGNVAAVGLKGLSHTTHDTGHYHLYAQTHEHGKAGDSPHSHKERQYHPQPSDLVHHHAVADHAV